MRSVALLVLFALAARADVAPREAAAAPRALEPETARRSLGANASAANASATPTAAPTAALTAAPTAATVASVAAEGLPNAKLAGPQYTFTALWCGGFLVAAAAPFVLGLYPEADSMDGTLVDSAIVDTLRVFLPYFTVFLDMMQISAVAFLPSIGWDGDWTFFRWWSWGLYMNGEFQAVFFFALFMVAFCVTPCVFFWRSLSESNMVKLFTNTLAMTIFNIIFSGMACSADGGPSSGASVDGWGLPTGSCTRGMSQMMIVLAFFAAAYFGALVVTAGVKSMHEDEWPRGVYCFLFDAFVNRALLALYGALLGFSGSSRDGAILKRLLLTVCCASIIAQLVARPHLKHSPRLHALRMTAEFFKLVVAIAANSPKGANYLLICACVVTVVLGIMSMAQICCCCLTPASEQRRAKYEITIGISGAPMAPDLEEEPASVQAPTPPRAAQTSARVVPTADGDEA